MDKLTKDELCFISDLLLSLLNSYHREISLLDKSLDSYDRDLVSIKDKYNFVVRIWAKLGVFLLWINSVYISNFPFLRIKKLVKIFNSGSVQVSGCKGTGKDVLFGNVIRRQKKPYISNLNYGGTCYPFCL